MCSPSQLLKIVPTKIRTPNRFSLHDYRISMLNSVKPHIRDTQQHDDSTLNDHTSIRNLTLFLISKYHVYKKLDIERFKIVPMMRMSAEKDQLPQLPSTLDGLSDYVYDLTRIPNFELTANNQAIKPNILESLKESEDSSIVKLLLINEIISPSSKTSVSNYFKKLSSGSDTDIQYLAWLLYYMNPDKLEKLERFNQLCNVLDHIKDQEILSHDWEFTHRLVNSNISSFQTGTQSKNSFILDKLVGIVNGIHTSYQDFDLVNIFRILRNAETGYEDTDTFKLIRFNIGYYRYLLLDKLTNEWNKGTLTDELWTEKKLHDQWTIIYDIYYGSKDAIKPGGPTFENKIKKTISR